MTHGIEGLENELLAQRELFLAREPGYARVLELVKGALPTELGARLSEAWAQRSFHASYERPLLLLAALRYDALCDGESHPLRSALAGLAPNGDELDADKLALALAPSRQRFFDALKKRAVQTNETSRAAAWLWPAHLLHRAGETRALTLIDLGTSAGLNLIADELPTLWTDETGAALSVAPRPEVHARHGYDIAPLDVRKDDDALWLRACVWASDAARLLRLEEGLARFRANAAHAGGPRLHTCSLTEVPSLLEALPGDSITFCVQSIVRDYLGAEQLLSYERNMRELLLRKPPRSIIWSQLELDPSGGSMERAAAITVRFVDAHGTLRELVLANTHPHPKQLFRHAHACDELITAWGAHSRPSQA